MGTLALCVVDFFTPTTTGEDTDTDDTNCKEERGEEGGDVSLLMLTLAASRTRVLGSLPAKCVTERHEEPSVGTTAFFAGHGLAPST